MAKVLRPAFAEDDFPIIGLDNGNDKSKASRVVYPKTGEVLDGGSDSAYFKDSIQQNAVIAISESEYNKQAAAYRGKRPNYGYIKWDGRYFAVGDTAMNYMRDMRERRIKNAKFSRDYYGLLFIRALMALYNGNPPTDVHVVGGHPPFNRSKKQDIEDSLRGNWSVEFLGEKHQIKVHSVRSDDEISAAAFNLRYRIDGQKDGHFKQDGIALGFDLGGGTLDVVLLNEQGKPIDGTHDSTEIGIIDCVLNFKALFDEVHGAKFPHNPSGISLETVYTIFRDKQHTLRGGGIPDGQIECGDLFEQAVYGELNRMYVMIDQMVPDYQTRANSVTIFGGAGELVYNELAESIFSPYADSGHLAIGTREIGCSILNASRGLAKLGQFIRRGERQKVYG